MKKIKLPDTLVLIFSIMILTAVLTWLVPGGEYQRHDLNGRSVVVPESYQAVSHQPQGLSALLIAPIRGFIEAANIIAFVLIVGGAFFVVQKTGAVDAFIHYLAAVHERSRWLRILFIPITMTVFSLFGSVFGMSEEVLPFILVFVPLAISLGYDSITGVAIPFVGAGAGFAGAFMNPFTVGIAQGIAGLPPSSGFGYRAAVWAVVTLTAIVFVVFYAKKIKAAPKRSRMYEADAQWRAEHAEAQHVAMTGRHRWIIVVFSLSMILLILGVKYKGWYIQEISALFLGMAILTGFISHLSVSELSRSFVNGAKELVQVAFIIALARSILVIASDGLIIDSILHGLAGLVSGVHPVVAAQLMFVVQSAVNLFIPSGSGQAALVMPIMAPLSDLLHVTRQTAVLAFQMGDGFTNLIIPTSGVTMGVLGLARIPYEKWFGWMISLQVIFFILALVLLIPPVLLNWGPF